MKEKKTFLPTGPTGEWEYFLHLEILYSISTPERPILRWIEYEGMETDNGLLGTRMGGYWHFTKNDRTCLQYPSEKERKLAKAILDKKYIDMGF
jgi:hypothetical protein